MMIVLASIAVAIVCFIIYALDRRAKKEPISWENATKISLFGGLLTSAVVFSTSVEGISEVIKNVEIPSAVQDMFVGVPTF
jgi:hypothetical protein